MNGSVRKLSPADTRVHVAVEAARRRLWALCYRMTGNRAEADDLCQEAISRAVERADEIVADDPTGFLLRMTTRLCLDHLRHRKVERRVAELVDPVDLPDAPLRDRASDPEAAAILREDIRYAVVVALQRLTPRQRSVIVLRDICDGSLGEVAEALGTNENSVKALLHRARTALAEARRHEHVDVPCDASVVEKFAAAVEAGSIEQITDLLAEDVWGVVDGGGIVQAAKKPTFGRRAVSRQWSNAKRRLAMPVITDVRRLNGEDAVVIRLADSPGVVVAIVHFETRGGRVVALRVNRDPCRVAYLDVAVK